MADLDPTAMIRSLGGGVCDIVRGWPLCDYDGSVYTITTHCQLPNGSLVRLRVRRVEGGWVVSDGGMAVDEAVASGISRPSFGLNVRRALRTKGLHLTEGCIESPKVSEDSLFNAVVIVANSCRDIAENLIFAGGLSGEGTLERRTREILVERFHTWVLKSPVIICGASDRQHKFDTALDLPDGRKVLVDVVRHQGNSINSAIVSNLDIARLNDDRFVQRIVFDPVEDWKSEEIELLSVGATPVALPSLADAIERLAA